MKSYQACILVLFSLVPNAVYGTQLFYDDFEHGFVNWTGVDYKLHHGAIVQDPTNTSNYAMSFTGLTEGGDIMSLQVMQFQIGKSYCISLDYLGKQTIGSTVDDFGGFAGLREDLGTHLGGGIWVFGTMAGYPDIRQHLIDDGTWHHYSYQFVWGRSDFGVSHDSIRIVLEDFWASGNSTGDAFFDNISVEIIPEPVTFALLGIGGVLVSRRTK